MATTLVQVRIDDELKNQATAMGTSKAERAARALQELSEAAIGNGVAEMTLEEINAEIDAVRKKSA